VHIEGGRASVSGHTAVTGRRAQLAAARQLAADPAVWMTAYLRGVVAADGLCALAAGIAALLTRFTDPGKAPAEYVILTTVLPLVWWLCMALARGYDERFIGLGSDEFRRVLNAGVSLIAGVAIVSYLTKSDVARGYVVVALPGVTLFTILTRYALRKRLHRKRRLGACMRRTIVVGHAASVSDLVTELRRETYHGLSIVGTCLAGRPLITEVAGVPVCGGLDRVSAAVAATDADTVAVVACRELNGVRLRELAWELEKTGTDLCVAPALMDVAGPRTTIRPVAGLPLLHVDHPDLRGARQVVKGVFDKAAALTALALLFPLMAGIALAIRLEDRGPVLFRQVRVGKDGRPFTVLKFRTMVADAEGKKSALAQRNNGNGPLFKIRNDPRVTRPGAWLRRWSLDELPQLFNVLKGDMSLVGPRPPLPDEAACYGYYVRRRLAVKPGMTGLWQIKGRSDLSWDEAVRLDVRYVENWSLALDLQILWKTWSAVVRGSGAY
jgi:exopolysaccharide biosynthesis polyprenyl glycosylphosphotransferase